MEHSAGKQELGKVSETADYEGEKEKVLCPHCLRTNLNNLKCKGICVADNDY